jgi:tRNA U34 5-methylaminomethyl-2-thiouridine-forming methyltransferase MnmC
MKVIITADGSSSIYVEELDEQYHSVHGAVNESMHVYIKYGLEFKTAKKKEISILEMGFGTGLNTLLTYLNNNSNNINYVSLEKFPVLENIVDKLNYNEIEGASNIFNKLHELDWNKEHSLSESFTFTKVKTGLEEFESSKKFDVIYYDAFAPDVQPELWTEDIFRKCFELLNNNGCLVTYCAKGQVKRNLKSAGFTLEGLPGPKGKREMTRAIKNEI